MNPSLPLKLCCYHLVVEMDISDGFSSLGKLFQREVIREPVWVGCTHLERASASLHFLTGGGQ